MTLPRFAVIKSTYNSKYLSYIKDEEGAHQFLKFSGDEVVSPLAKYAIEPAKSGNGLVHIRCCYNNKYWARWKTTNWWIIAGADQPEEDQSKSTCTLFEPLYVDDAKTTIRIRHVQLGHYVNIMPLSGNHYDRCLYAASASPDSNRYDLLTITDWESLVILPKHVAFKGPNGSFLGGVWAESHQYLQFATDDMADERAGHEILTNGDGSIHIKCNHFSGRFWRAVPDWIWADTTDINNDSDLLFWPIKVSENVIALRNLNNNKFCQMVNMDNKTRCLRASAETISENARMEVHELVFSRSIYNVTYRLEEARIYNESVLTLATTDVDNTSDQYGDHALTLSYEESTSKTWTSNVSLNLGISTTIKTGIPIIAEGEIDISVEFGGSYEWGREMTETSSLEITGKVVVPPKTKVVVKLLATQGKCDVPFSYTQSDHFVNGNQILSTHDDGVYTGINCFNFTYDITEEKL